MGLNSLHTKINHKHSNPNAQTTTRNKHNYLNNKGSNNKNISIMVPYTKGIGEKLKNTWSSLGI